MAVARSWSPPVQVTDVTPRMTNANLSLYLRCQDFVLSLDTRWIEKLLLPHEVADTRPGSPGTVCIAGEHRAWWNLGALFRVPHDAASFILLNTDCPLGSLGGVPLALSAGPLLKVGPTPTTTPLPAGLFRERRGAIRGAFASDAVAGGLAGAALGLELDPRGLFSAEMIESSAKAVAGARGGSP